MEKSHEFCNLGKDDDYEAWLSGKNIWNPIQILKRRAAFYSRIDEHFKDGKYTDVNIICQDRVFKCHRLVLAAASEYFHLMFGGNFLESQARDVSLPDFDSVTLEHILRFVYRGEIVTINDDNVYNLLRASEILRLSEIEYFCVHYLTHKRIPIDWALKIYLFAASLNKVSLIPVTARFILKHLDRFCQESEFLKMPFDDFSTLLAYFQASSSSREKTLLNAIFTWVCSSTDVREERKSAFMELTQKVQFKSVSETYVSEYFNRNSDDSINDVWESGTSDASDIDSSTNVNDERSLHVFVGTAQRNMNHNNISRYRPDDISQGKDNRYPYETCVFSLDRSRGATNVDFHKSGEMRPPAEMMRIVESAGRLYSLKLDRKWFFTTSATINLSDDLRSLTLPLGSVFRSSIKSFDFYELTDPFSLCGLQEDIYLCNFKSAINFQRYNTQLDTWCPVPAVNEVCDPVGNMISDDTRLYLIGRRPSDWPFFGAYDPRAGKVELLNNDGLSRLNIKSTGPGSFHKSRIYLPEYNTSMIKKGGSSFKMAIYDPVGGRWDVQNLKTNYADYRRYGYRLVSFDNRLWRFGRHGSHVCTQTYDSYLQEWDTSNHLVLDNAIRKSDMVGLYITEVIALKSL